MTPVRTCITVQPDRLDLAVDAAVEALRQEATADADRIYSRGGVLVRIRRDRAGSSRFQAAADPPTITLVDEDLLAHYRLPGVADFVHVDGRKPVLFSHIAKGILAIDAEGFRRIAGVVVAPVLRPDGTILLTPGYDDATGLFYAPEPTFEGFSVPDNPTPEDVELAAEVLREIYGDFAWKDPKVDAAAAMSFVFTLFSRDAIKGSVPIHAVTAPNAGSGKTTAIDVGANIFFGQDAPRWDAPRNEDEEKKSLLALAVSGQRCILADNHPEDRPFGSAEISKAVTGDRYQGRILGHTREVIVPMHAVWGVTGNNLTFKDTVGRRVILSRIDTRLEDPTTRAYARPDLLEFVRANRRELVWSVLTILRAHAVAVPESSAAGTERPFKKSFIEWDKLVRGALLFAGLGDCDGARNEVATELDTDREILDSVLPALGTIPFVVGDLIHRADTSGPIRAVLESATSGKKLSPYVLGNLLKTLKDRPCNGLVLRKKSKMHGSAWQVVRANDP